MSPTLTTKNSKQKDIIWQQYRLFLAVAEYQILGGKHFLSPETSIRKDLVVQTGTIPSEKVSLPMDPSCVARTQVGLFITLAISYVHLS